MFAIVEIAGKQFKVSKGDVLEVPKLKGVKEGGKVTVDEVLLKADGAKAEIGTPKLVKSSVELEIKSHGKGEKIRVFKKKPKKRYERTIGHRQAYTQVEVVGIK